MKQQPKNLFESHLQKVKIQHMPEVRTILDIGCGDGSVFEGTGYEVHGYDQDNESLEQCSKVSEYKKVSSEFIFNPEEYDIVTLLGVLEHMDKESMRTMFRKLINAKALYITVPNANSFHRQIGKEMGILKDLHELSKQDYEIGHKRYYDIQSLREELFPFYLKGFVTKRVGSTGFKVSTSIDMIPYLSRIKFLEKVAETNNLIGRNNFSGAELFIYLNK